MPCVFFPQIFRYFREKWHFRFHVLASIWRVPTGLKIDQFHSTRMSHLVSAEKLKYNQLFVELFLVQKSSIAGKFDLSNYLAVNKSRVLSDVEFDGW